MPGTQLFKGWNYLLWFDRVSQMVYKTVLICMPKPSLGCELTSVNPVTQVVLAIANRMRWYDCFTD